MISLNKPQAVPFELKPFIHLSHKLDHFISLLFKILTISNLYISWNRFSPSFCKEFLKLFPDQTELIEVLPLPVSLYSVYTSSNLGFLAFLKKFCTTLRTVKRFISGKVVLEFDNYKHVAMKAAISDRNLNFYEDKGKFIRSSLNCEK